MKNPLQVVLGDMHMSRAELQNYIIRKAAKLPNGTLSASFCEKGYYFYYCSVSMTQGQKFLIQLRNGDKIVL